MRGIYFGWYVVAATTVIYTLVVGATFASFGLFVVPVSEEFDLSRADVNSGLIALNLGNALLAPVIGRLIDRMSARKVMVASSLLFGGSLAIISQSHSLLLDVVLMVVMAAGLLGSGTLSGSVLLARWFTVQRARAMALASLGFSFGGIVVAPVVGQLIETQGWRFAVLMLGCFCGVLLAFIGMFMRDRPGPGDIEVPGASALSPAPADETRLPQGEDAAAAPAVPGTLAILRMPLFWLLSLGIGISSSITQGITVSLVPIALSAGLTTVQSSILISATGIAGVVAMLVLAAWGDRADRTTLLTAIILVVMVPCALLLVAKSYIALMLTALLLGFTTAILAPTYIALMADRFGLSAFGTVRGLLVPVMSVTSALSVRFIGEVYDRTKSYEAGLWTYLALSLLAAALVVSSRVRKAAT